MPEAIPHYYDLAHGFTVFCDDIRQEVGLKQTYVGVYNAAMILLGDFPAVVPKLAFSVRYREPISLPASKKLTLRILLEEGDSEQLMLETETMTFEQMKANGARLDMSKPDEPSYSEIAINGVFAPLVINGPSRLKVRMYRDEEEVRLGVLIIQRAESQALPGVPAGVGAPVNAAGGPATVRSV
jgi:hypothetical protein